MLRVDDDLSGRPLTLDLGPVEEPSPRLCLRPPINPPNRQFVDGHGTISACCYIGGRSRNLDRFDVRLNGSDVLVAVFDGHGTGHVVEYAWKNLLRNVVQSKWYASNLERAIAEAFRLVEQEVMGWQSTCDAVDGCVAVIAVIRGNSVTIGNIGDCRALKIHTDGQEEAHYEQLSIDHNPENLAQEQLIRSKGGLLLRVQKSLRVNGEINVTRSIGDKRLKHILSSEPQVNTFALDRQDKLLVLASDGLCSIASNHSVSQQLRRCSSECNIAKALVQGLNVRSSDNITVVVVRL